MFRVICVILALLLLGGFCLNSDDRKSQLANYLFPNRNIVSLNSSRSLATSTVPCVICRGLVYCQALNGFEVEEVYTPDNLGLLTTCNVLEALGKRMNDEIFGPGRSFRDNSECREIVLEYLCLFYGSNNAMYTNLCIYEEDVSNPNPANWKISPRYPCRSFCTQVATVCAQDPDFLLLCQDIACPPTQDECTPDPTIGGVTLAANLECTTPYDSNPYVRKSDAWQSTEMIYILSTFSCLFMVMYMMFI